MASFVAPTAKAHLVDSLQSLCTRALFDAVVRSGADALADALPDEVLQLLLGLAFDDADSGLRVLPTIQGAGNAPDLLGSESMRTLLEKLKTDFDLVVVDSPPVLLVSDAMVLGRICDKMVFVVKWEETPRQAAQEAVHRMRQFGVDVAGVAMSRIDTKRGAEYGGYGDSYYRNASKYYVN